MKIFADTSGFYAALVSSDKNHVPAAGFLRARDPNTPPLVTSSFVLLELVTLLQARVGLAAVRDWQAVFEPSLEVIWVETSCYREATSALVSANRREVSLTDWTSFVLMRRNAISRAFTFDQHFAEQGFTVLPR